MPWQTKLTAEQADTNSAFSSISSKCLWIDYLWYHKKKTSLPLIQCPQDKAEFSQSTCSQHNLLKLKKKKVKRKGFCPCFRQFPGIQFPTETFTCTEWNPHSYTPCSGFSSLPSLIWNGTQFLLTNTKYFSVTCSLHFNLNSKEPCLFSRLDS